MGRHKIYFGSYVEPPPVTEWVFAVNFRDTAGYVTDGVDETYCLNENYPVSRAGFTFGFTDGLGGDRTRDRDSALDPRLAGGHFTNSSSSQDRVLIFRVDLPTTGDYKVRLAVGDPFNTRTNQKAEVFDDTSSLGVLVNDASTAAAHWVDATNVERTSESDWITNNAFSGTLTFATTTFILKIGTTNTASDNTFLTHLYIELIPAAGDETVIIGAALSAVAGIQAAVPSVTNLPSALSAVAGAQAPTPNVTTLPAALSAVAGAQAPTPNVTTLPAALSSVASTQAPSIRLDTTQTPAVLSSVAGVVAPVPEVRTLPSALSVTASTQAPSVVIDCTLTPSVLSALASVQTPIPEVRVLPDVLSAIASVLAPTIDVAGDGLTVPVGVISVTAAIQSPDKSVTTEPAVLSVVAGTQAPVIVLSILPSALSTAASVQGPSPALTLSPAALSALASNPAASVEIRVTVGELTVVTSVNAASVLFDKTVFPSVLSVVASVVAPNIDILADISTVSAVFSRARERTFESPARSRTFVTAAAEREFASPARPRTFQARAADRSFSGET